MQKSVLHWCFCHGYKKKKKEYEEAIIMFLEASIHIDIQISWFTKLYHLHSMATRPPEAQFSTVGLDDNQTLKHLKENHHNLIQVV